MRPYRGMAQIQDVGDLQVDRDGCGALPQKGPPGSWGARKRKFCLFSVCMLSACVAPSISNQAGISLDRDATNESDQVVLKSRASGRSGLGLGKVPNSHGSGRVTVTRLDPTWPARFYPAREQSVLLESGVSDTNACLYSFPQTIPND